MAEPNNNRKSPEGSLRPQLQLCFHRISYLKAENQQENQALLCCVDVAKTVLIYSANICSVPTTCQAVCEPQWNYRHRLYLAFSRNLPLEKVVGRRQIKKQPSFMDEVWLVTETLRGGLEES